MGAFFSAVPPGCRRVESEAQGIRTLYEYEDDHSPIEFVTGRVKPVASILEKARRKSIPLHEIETMQDIAGLRIMCQFVDDIQIVKEMLFARKDFTVVDQRIILRNIKRADTDHTILLCCTLCRRYPEKSMFS